jgi:hypothetical protein
MLVQGSIRANAEARSVTSLSIDETGASSTKRDVEACRRFVPNADQLRDYFDRALPVPDRVVTTLRFSPCYAKGHLKFSDGHEANWSVSSGGGGGLDWSTGGGVYLFHRPNGWFDPYAGMYDDELDGDGNAK